MSSFPGIAISADAMEPTRRESIVRAATVTVTESNHVNRITAPDAAERAAWWGAASLRAKPAATESSPPPPFPHQHQHQHQEQEQQEQEQEQEMGKTSTWLVTMDELYTGWFEVNNMKGAAGSTVHFQISTTAGTPVEFGMQDSYTFGASGAGSFRMRFAYVEREKDERGTHAVVLWCCYAVCCCVVLHANILINDVPLLPLRPQIPRNHLTHILITH